MPPIRHQTLTWVTVGAALLGQYMIDARPQLAIAILGTALASALMDGWWYPVPLPSRWWYPALIGVLGLSLWQEPRGWFFMAWAAIEIGTGLRASHLWKLYMKAMAEEQARLDRLAAWQATTDEVDPAEDDDAETAAAAEREQGPDPELEPAPVPRLRPIPIWRYGLALLLGAVAAWLGAWVFLLFVRITGWQIDLLAVGVGFVVGRAVAAGAGDRSIRHLRTMAAILSGFGVLYSRYLLIHVIFGGLLGPFLTVPMMLYLTLLIALGCWAGWRYTEAPEEG